MIMLNEKGFIQTTLNKKEKSEDLKNYYMLTDPTSVKEAISISRKFSWKSNSYFQKN